RRVPSARLYLALPRESQWPSTVTCVLVQRFIQSALRWRIGRASSRIVDSSRSKCTVPSGISAFNCANVFCAKSCSSVSGAGGRGAAGGGGGGGGGGGVGAAAGGGGGGAGAGAGTFLWQPASAIAELSTATVASVRKRIIVTLLVESRSLPGESLKITKQWLMCQFVKRYNCADGAPAARDCACRGVTFLVSRFASVRHSAAPSSDQRPDQSPDPRLRLRDR